MDRNRSILTYLRNYQDEMVAMLQQMVEYESPTDNKSLLDRFSEYIAGEFSSMGLTVETLIQEGAGNHLKVVWGQGNAGGLILCHMDTVWETGTIAKRPVKIENGRLYGPGAEDMKGGIVIAYWAIKALRELAITPKYNVTMLFTSDEETGSLTSHPIIEKEAIGKEFVFVLEPAQPPLGSYKTSRKGVGEFKIIVEGVASHAGADHEKGVNAIEELAHQILSVQRFTDYEKGTTFNVGVVHGGTRSNVVPSQAIAEIDVRIQKQSEAQAVIEKMNGLQTHLPGAKMEVKGSFNRPPMERTPATVALFEKAKEVAKSMNLEITEAAAGGASDGNFTSAMGIPTLDGMGAVGDGGHALHEYVEIASLPERAAILAALLLV